MNSEESALWALFAAMSGKPPKAAAEHADKLLEELRKRQAAK